MNTSLRKIFALILCLCLCMSLMPAALAADADSAPALSLSETESFDAATGVLINANTFPDPIFRRYVEENCDTNGDLVLTAEEIAAVKEMDVSGLGISSLDGIAAFPYLTMLNCSGNHLQTLDVSGLPYLETLYCGQNFPDYSNGADGLSNLIPGRALKRLDCSGNSLTGEAMRLNRCPDLEYLSCSYNPIGTLDLSAVRNLRALYCYNAALTALDLSYTPDLHVLWCGWDDLNSVFLNKIARLNLAACPGLVDAVIDGTREDNLYHARFFKGEYELRVPASWEPTMQKGIPEMTLYLGGKYDPLTVKHTYSPDPVQTDEFKIKADESNFPDPVFLAQVKTFDSNNDGYLSDRELNGIKTLNISGDLASLEGIGYFSGINKLKCASTALTTLDLSGLEQLYDLDLQGCTALADLKVEGCISLITLNISGCTSLSTLSLHDFAVLKTLNAEGCTGLTTLKCYYNALTSLNVNGCTALRVLDCYSNGLAALDVSSCTNLETLDCGYNKLTALNLSGNTKLTELTCLENALTGLDVSMLTALQSLNCYGNPLNTLDVTQNTALTGLYCANTGLNELDVTKNTKLTGLSCSANNLTALDVSALQKLSWFFCEQNQIATLDLRNNPCLVKAMKMGEKDAGGGLLSWQYTDPEANPTASLHELIFVLVCDSTTTLLPAVERSDYLLNLFPDETFRSYVLDSFDSTHDGILSTAEIAAVTEIDCSGRGISSLKGLENFTALTSLDCSNNALKELDISRNNALTTLDCSGNRLTELDTGRNPALTELYCANNALANVSFNNNYALEKLDCAHNNLVTINIIDCDTIAEFITSGIKPTVKDGVTTYSGRFQRGSEAPKDMLLACDSGVTLGDYPIPDCVLPASLQRLEEEALQGCAFRCVLLQKGVTAIGSRAFADSPKLFAVYIPASVTDIAADAFANVSGLTIYGEPDSAAQSFARDQHIPFIAFN